MMKRWPESRPKRNVDGQKFGRLTVLHRVGKRDCMAQCECGAVKQFDMFNIIQGFTSSCGCLHKERTSAATTKERPCYNALHDRVRRRRGRPSHCEHCGTTDPTRRYHWANLTRRYDDVNDYVRLCIPCHARMDRSKGPPRL